MVKLLRRGLWGAMVLLVVVAGMANRVVAAETEGLERTLTGGASRAWMMGAEGPCGVADSFTFATDHRLFISRCIGGRLVTTRHTWQFQARDGATSLMISNLGTFDLLEVGAGVLPGSRAIRLRATAAQVLTPIELQSPPD